jgi:NADH pyrophosphatase NudC (nudix superfamily)
MNFCPECGSKLESRWIGSDARLRRVCTGCGKTCYENPRILVANMVAFGHKLLLCRRAEPPSQGRWTPPSGFVEIGETLEQAAARETYEEAGVLVMSDELDLYAVTSLPTFGEVYVCFRSSVESDVCRPGTESLEVRFFCKEEIPWNNLAFAEIAGFLQLYFREHSEKAFGIHLSRVDANGRYRNEYRIAYKTRWGVDRER